MPRHDTSAPDTSQATREAAMLRAMYERLAETYGPQHWWPGETPLEITLGAYLTQNTSWRAVERSLGNLRQRGLLGDTGEHGALSDSGERGAFSDTGEHGALSDTGERGAFDAATLLAMPEEELRMLLRPSGYMVRKTAAIRAFLGFLFAEAGGSFKRLATMRTEVLRPKLLALPGVGPETADAILLYALGHEAMVVDEYLRRVTVRHGLAPERSTYDEIQRLAWSAFAGERGKQRVRHANEFHALIVMVGKEQCGPKPRCAGCPLACFPALLPER
jgi:endonuclease-3 related protein